MTLRAMLVYGLLLSVKAFSRVFYRHRPDWVGVPQPEKWDDMRLGVLLHHTSLYEPLFTGSLPNKMLKKMATSGAVPIADKTLQRPVVGFFFKMIAAQVISVTRERDQTWQQMLDAVRPDSMIVLMPEGRMKRKDGKDSEGREMTVRGGIADIIKAIPDGVMMIGYSGGLHHVQHPGQWFPRPFKTLRLRFEAIDIGEYRESLMAVKGAKGFKRAVVNDLTRRRDENCPPPE